VLFLFADTFVRYAHPAKLFVLFELKKQSAILAEQETAEYPD